MISFKVPVILGSKSPRRHELLKHIVDDFSIYEADVDESFDESTEVFGLAEHLAIRKNEAIYPNSVGSLLITADSVVICDGVVYNKPADADEAFAMLSSLSGKTHTVVTGVCVRHNDKTVSFSGITQVTFAAMSPDEINYYITNFAPYDKAGSYGIQDWIGATQVVSIEGSYTNIMGLPTQGLYNVLISNFNHLI